jgi:hypothetical protein
MRVNAKMQTLLHTFAGVARKELPPALRYLVADRFLTDAGCFFLEGLYRQKGNASRRSFQDEVGYECYVNHIHLDDFAQEDLLRLGLACMQEVGNNWARQSFAETLRVILSLEHDNCVLRFHVVRPGQSWLNDDLESYGSAAIAVNDYSGKKR